MSEPDDAANAITRLKTMLERLSSTGALIPEIMEKMNQSFKEMGMTLENNTAATGDQVKLLGALGAVVLKTKVQYEALGNYDFSGMTAQLKKLLESADGLNRIGALTGFIGGARAATQFATELATKADNILRLESGYIKLASATGDLGKVMSATGVDFEKLSDLTMTQGQLMLSTEAATGHGTRQVQEYYNSLGKLPGMLTEVVETSNGAVSAFTAAIQVADGSGRSMAEVTSDLTKAYDAYALKGNDALNFSVKLAEAQRNNGVTMDVFKIAIHSTADAFRGFADTGIAANKMAEGGINIFNNYIEGIKKTGASAEDATRMVQGMTSQIKEMGIGQKAFLSAQTGGPGGLMGAFQIDKMLKDGDIEGVFKKVRDQMQKQLGPIVTLEDATKSPAAAAQLARQTAMLRSGPLGGMAKTDMDAYRIAESMKTGAPPPKELTDTVESSMGRGQQLEDRRSLGVVKNINDLLNEADLAGGMEALKILGNNLGESKSFNTLSTDDQAERKAASKASRQEALLITGKAAQGVNKAINTGTTNDMPNVIGEAVTSRMNAVLESINSLPKSLEAAAASLKNAVSTGNDQQIRQEFSKLYNGSREDDKTQIGAIGEQLESVMTPAALRTIMPTDDVATVANNAMGRTTVSWARNIKPNKATDDTNQSSRNNNISGGQQQEHKVHLTVTAICAGCNNELETKQLTGMSQAHSHK